MGTIQFHLVNAPCNHFLGAFKFALGVWSHIAQTIFCFFSFFITVLFKIKTFFSFKSSYCIANCDYPSTPVNPFFKIFESILIQSRFVVTIRHYQNIIIAPLNISDIVCIY